MSSFSKEEISRRLSHTLDFLGYSPEMVQHRKYLYSILEPVPFSIFTLSKTKTGGSRGEGLVKMFESDWDVLYSCNCVLAVEDHVGTELVPKSVSVFHMMHCLLHPGHFKLLLIRLGTVDHLTFSCLNPDENGLWMSSKEFVTIDNEDNYHVSGPAITSQLENFIVPFDHVLTFRCICPHITQQWLQRPRQHDWPSSELRERISHMPANIVPTGHKGCHDEEIEWRLCFNEIELLLVDSWNDTQRKLYKVLKMIKKDVFVIAGFKISSYMMKNIVLWLSEAYPQSDFKPGCLMSWIIKCLNLLRKAVKVYNLPYFMIPGRNLISERIPRRQCKGIIREISDLIHCGPQLLWECKKLEFTMSMTPNELLYYKDRCDRLEVLYTFSWIQSSFGVDVSYYKIQIAEIFINSQWPPAVTNMLKDKTTLMAKLKVLFGGDTWEENA